MFKIGQFLIAPEVVELIPESVARENGVLPLRLSGRQLHILLANDRGISDTLQKLEFILNLDISYEIDEPGTVYEMVDTVYSMQTARVTRCNLNFALTCSRKWLELGETDSPVERHCPDCNERVYHCETEAQAERHARLGHCVSLHVLYETEVCESTGLIEFPELDRTSPEWLKGVDILNQME